MSSLLSDPKFKSWKKSILAKKDTISFLTLTGGRKQMRHFVYLIFDSQEMKQKVIDKFGSFVMEKDPKEIREEEPRASDRRPPEFF